MSGKDPGTQPQKGTKAQQPNQPPKGGVTDPTPKPKAMWMGEEPIVTTHRDGKLVSNLSKEEQDQIKESYENSTLKIEPSYLPQKIDTKVTEGQMINIVSSISNSLGTTHTISLHLIYMLFLRGASNKGAPDSLAATYVVEGERITLFKGDLMHAYKLYCRNNYLRRLAEYMATKISQFAEANNLNGDIYPRISSLMDPNEQPLSAGERAWCSSFNQKNPDCIETHPRVATMLNVEYRLKFLQQTPPSPKKAPAKKQPARRKGQGNKNKNKSNQK